MDREGPSSREISQMLNEQAFELGRVLLPGAREAGGMLHAGSVRGEPGDSLKIRRRGTWADYARATGDPEGMGDMLKLVYLTVGERDWARTFQWARGWLGIESMDPAALERQRKRAAAAQERATRERAEGIGKSQARARALWHGAAPIVGTPAIAYLAGRGIDFATIGTVPRAVRFRHDVWHNELRRKVPAMVTAGIRGREHVATHVVYLDRRPDGVWDKVPALIVEGKPLKVAKKIFGRDYFGAAFPLTRGASGRPLHDMPAGEPIHVAEGIEDALTFAMIHPEARVLFAGVLGMIGQVDVPPQCGDFIIIAQRDAPGSPAAESFEKQVLAQQVRARADGSGRRVFCHWPAPGFKDLNDELRGIGMRGGDNGGQG